MLGANLIGFQSMSYLQHFLSSCTRILYGVKTYGSHWGVKANGSHFAVGVFPIGIDVARVEANASRPGIEEKMKAITEMYAGKKIIVGRDRLDSVRGVMQKLRAFEAFLEMYGEWREKVSKPLFFFACPSSQSFISLIVFVYRLFRPRRLCLNMTFSFHADIATTKIRLTL